MMNFGPMNGSRIPAVPRKQAFQTPRAQGLPATLAPLSTNQGLGMGSYRGPALPAPHLMGAHLLSSCEQSSAFVFL